MKAADVMATNVISVGPEASVEDVARTLLSARVSAVPVVGPDGKLMGIVSEGDLMRRAEAGTGRRQAWWPTFPRRPSLDAARKERLAGEFVQEHARKVTDVMTREVVTAAPDSSLAAIAGLLETNGIKRVPIVQRGRLVGIVSRANLLQALAGRERPAQAAAPIADRKIRKKVLAQLAAEPWRTPSPVNVIVQDGTVQLWGTVASAAEKAAMRVAAEATPGVRGVDDRLTVRAARPDGRFVRPPPSYDRKGVIIGVIAGILILSAAMVILGVRL
jgi:CBS domain-containing protein